MKIYSIFLMIILMNLFSCSNKNYQIIEASVQLKPNIFGNDFEKVVYKTTFEFYGRTITGITIIKRTDSSYRMISMSEIGLKYFDMEFFMNSEKDPTIHYIMEVLNRKLLIKRLTFDFGLLFNYPTEKLRVGTDDQKIIKSGEYIYARNNNIENVIKSNFLFKNRALIKVIYSHKEYPSSIDIIRSKIQIEFNEIARNKEMK